MKRIPALILALSCAFWLLSCGPRYTYNIPEHTGDGWETGSLEDVGMDQKKLGELVKRIRRNKFQNIHAILIVKDGKLVFEEYFDGYRFDYDNEQFRGDFVEFDLDTSHNIMSITKAVTAALVGIGIDQGLIQGKDQAVAPFFPQYSDLLDERKHGIKIEHLLTMSSRLQWNEWDVPLTSTENDLIQLFIVSDPIEYILAKELIHDPGSYWYYSGGDVNLLGAVFEKATDRKIDEFSEQYLFSPLGIHQYEWKYINADVVYASGELRLRPRDMAKIGYLYLNGGIWKGKQIISSEWIEKSAGAYISTKGRSGQGEWYGYHWWIKIFNYDSVSIEALIREGWGGQAIILFPTMAMMVVLTGGNYDGSDPVYEIVSKFILPSAL